jgi:hypothetical protein
LVPNFTPRWKRFSGKYNSDKYLKSLKQKQTRNREMNESSYVKAAEGAQKFQRFNDKFGLEKIDDFFQIFPFFSRGYMPKQGLGVKRSFTSQPDGRKDWYTQFAGKSSEMQSFIKWAEANKKLPPGQLGKLKNVISQDSKKYEKSYWKDYENIKTGNSSQASRRSFYGTNATSPRPMPGDEKMRLNITDPKNKLFIKQDKMNNLISEWKKSQGNMGFARGFIPSFGKVLSTSFGPITAQQITRLKGGQHVNNKQTGEKLYLNTFTPADQAAIKKYEADNSKRVMAQRQQDSKAAKNQLQTIDASRQATMLVATKNLKQKVDSTIDSNGQKIRLKYRVEGIKNKKLADQESALRTKAEKFMLEQAHLTALKLSGSGQFAANTTMPNKVANAGSIGSAAGSIFETAIQSLGKNKLFTKNNATFDIQGFPDGTLKNLFGYYSPFADAKIGLTPGTKLDFNKKLLNLPKIQQKITGKQRREQGTIGRKTKKAASGYIPNFSKFFDGKGIGGSLGGLGLGGLVVASDFENIGDAPAMATLLASMAFGGGAYLGSKAGGFFDQKKKSVETKEVKIGNQKFPLIKTDYDNFKKLSNDIAERFKANNQALMDGLSGKIPMDNNQIKELDQKLKSLKREQQNLNLKYSSKSRGISSSMLKNLPKGMRRNVMKYGSIGKRFAMGYLPNFNKKAWMSSKEFSGNFSSGYNPNYSNPLMQALSREELALKERGIASSAIRIESSPSLKGPMNPRGLAVTNTVDEPLGVKQGIKRSKSMGIDPKTHGVTPNFALPAIPLIAKGLMSVVTTLPLLARSVATATKTIGGAAARGGKGLVSGMGQMDGFSMALMMGGGFIQEGIRGGKSDDEIGGARGLAMDVTGSATMGSLFGKRGALIGAGYGASQGLSRLGEREQNVKTFEKIIQQKKKLDEAMKDGSAIQKFAKGVAQLSEATKAGDFDAIVQAEGAIYDAMNSASDIKLIDALTKIKGSSMTAEEKLLALNKEMSKLAAEADRLAASVTLRENVTERRSSRDTDDISDWSIQMGQFSSLTSDWTSLKFDGSWSRAMEAGDRAGLQSIDRYATKEGREKAENSTAVIVSEVQKLAKQRVEEMYPEYMGGGQASLNLNEEAKRTQQLIDLVNMRMMSSDPEERKNLSKDINDIDFQFSSVEDKFNDILDLDIDDQGKIELLQKELSALAFAASEAGKLVGKTNVELNELSNKDLNVKAVQEITKSLLTADETERQSNMIMSGDGSDVRQSDFIKNLSKIAPDLADQVVSDIENSKVFRDMTSQKLIQEQERTASITQGFVTTNKDQQKPVDDKSRELEASYRDMVKRQKEAQQAINGFTQRIQLSSLSLDAWIENLTASLDFLSSTGAMSEEAARKQMNKANLDAFDRKSELSATQNALNILANSIDFKKLFDPSQFSSKKPTGMVQKFNDQLQQEDLAQNSQLAQMFEQFMKDTNNNPTLEDIARFSEKIAMVSERGNDIANEIKNSTEAAKQEAKIQRDRMIHKMKIAQGEAAYQRLMAMGSSAVTPGGRETMQKAIKKYGSGPDIGKSGYGTGYWPSTLDSILEQLNRLIAGEQLSGVTGVPEHVLAGTTKADLAFTKAITNLELAIHEAYKQGNEYLAEKFEAALEKVNRDKEIYDNIKNYVSETVGLPSDFSMDPMEQVSLQLAQIVREGLNLHQHTIDALGGAIRLNDFNEEDDKEKTPDNTSREGTKTGYYNEDDGTVRYDPTKDPNNKEPAQPNQPATENPSVGNSNFSQVVSSIQALSTSINSLMEPLNSLKNLPTELKTQLEAIIFNFAIEGEMKITLNTEEINAIVDQSVLEAVKKGLVEPAVLNAVTNRVKEQLNSNGVLD